MGYGGFYGGGGGNNLGEIARADAEKYKADTMAQAEDYKTDVAAGNVRGTGTLTHYRPISHAGPGGENINWSSPGPGGGPAAAKGDAENLQTAAQLGEPTSYAGGKGAPTPIEIFNAAGRSYVNPEGGAGYRTPTQAGQAWNQQNDVGEFRPVGTTAQELKNQGEVDKVKATGLATTAEAQVPGLKAAARTQEEAANNQTFRNAVGPLAHGKELDPKTGQWVPSTDPALTELVSRYHNLSYQNPTAAVQGLQKDYGALQDDRLYNQHAATVLNTDPRFSNLSQATKNLYLSGNPQMKSDLMPIVKSYADTQKQQGQVKQPYVNPEPFIQ